MRNEIKMELKALKLGHTYEQRFGLITSLSVHSLVFIIFIVISLHKESEVKTFHIQFTQMGEQTDVQSSHPANSPKINQPLRQKIIEQASEITQPPERVPEPVREREMPKIIEPEKKVIREETLVIKETPVKEQKAVIRNAAMQSHEAVKVASAPAPNPQPQTAAYKESAGTSGSLSHSALSGSSSAVDTAFGSSGAPVFLKRQMPVYPMMAKKLGKQGKVVLRLYVNEKGRLLHVEVVEAAGYGFTESAIEAVKMSTFSPAHEKGAGIASKALLTIRFVLKKV